jgi:hypothetical protein
MDHGTKSLIKPQQPGQRNKVNPLLWLSMGATDLAILVEFLVDRLHQPLYSRILGQFIFG